MALDYLDTERPKHKFVQVPYFTMGKIEIKDGSLCSSQ